MTYNDKFYTFSVEMVISWNFCSHGELNAKIFSFLFMQSIKSEPFTDININRCFDNHSVNVNSANSVLPILAIYIQSSQDKT